MLTVLGGCSISVCPQEETWMILKWIDFFFFKFVQTNLHGGKTQVTVMFHCLLMYIATVLNNFSVFLS